MTGRQRVFVRLVVVAAGLACVALPALGAEKPTWARPGCAVAPATVGIGAAPVVVGTGPVDQGATATMSSGFRPDGSAYVRVAAGDLEVTKTVTRAGSFTIRLDRGDDTVLIHISAGALTVTRGTAVADVDLDTVDEEELLAVRSLLAGSRSVRALREVKSLE